LKKKSARLRHIFIVNSLANLKPKTYYL